MVPPALGPRVLLRRLREVMAEPVTAQKRLDRIVEADRRQHGGGGVLDLCAAAGQVTRAVRHRRPEPVEAVHQSRLKLGEGLVGTDRARRRQPLNLADARSHPDFKYLPETGEEVYTSFLGVPILRLGRVDRRAGRAEPHPAAIYPRRKRKRCRPTAMVLAEIIASGDLKEVARAGEAEAARHVRSHHLRGESIGRGVGARPCRAARAARRHHQSDRREHPGREAAARGRRLRQLRAAGRRR